MKTLGRLAIAAWLAVLAAGVAWGATVYGAGVVPTLAIVVASGADAGNVAITGVTSVTGRTDQASTFQGGQPSGSSSGQDSSFYGGVGGASGGTGGICYVGGGLGGTAAVGGGQTSFRIARVGTGTSYENVISLSNAGVWTSYAINNLVGELLNESGQPGTVAGTSGQICRINSKTQNLVLSTGGTTTDSTIQIPANSIVLGLSAKITTTIATATDWSVGDATTADRFISAQSTLTSGTCVIGQRHMRGSVSTDAAGPLVTSATAIRVTTTGTPSAGRIRLSVHYLEVPTF